jgi:hypothetical protein
VGCLCAGRDREKEEKLGMRLAERACCKRVTGKEVSSEIYFALTVFGSLQLRRSGVGGYSCTCSFWSQMARFFFGRAIPLTTIVHLPLSFARDCQESEVQRTCSRESDHRGLYKGLGKKAKYF